ncbi:dephospho-CoA kinase, long form [Mycobacterium sp. M1]|uniref:Dephospho-CoA kinase n=1 Tax=Mycolicibacter acidiphilus TaxID=2835306 RepID=A0ABS5RJC6_9MYCO|nr:dephospho-CoA kinase, long form [Mycolicibacter acidiphilus]
MLRIGLTGGIGAGKSTVAATFAECGGIVVDGDVIAREVVEPGTEGLAGLVTAFGPGILLPDGALDRPALAAIAFSDDDKRATLNGIVHPLVARRRQELIDAAGADAIVVEDIPLLVESQMAPLFPLVVVVHADEEVRVARLTGSRGMPEADARARIAAQATEEQRRVVADVWLENHGTADDLAAQARELWQRRIAPFAANIEAGRAVPFPTETVPADPTWADQAQRIVARLRTVCGHRALRVEHIGPTVFSGDPGFTAPDVIDVEVTVPSPAVADELTEPLLAAGYPSVDGNRMYGSADPGRPTRVHVQVAAGP